MNPAPRPHITNSITSKIKTACGEIFVTISLDSNSQPFEIFIRFGKAGGCGSAMADGIARLCSYALRAGMPLKSVIKAFKGQSCYAGSTNNCLNQIALVLESYAASQTLPTETL